MFILFVVGFLKLENDGGNSFCGSNLLYVWHRVADLEFEEDAPASSRLHSMILALAPLQIRHPCSYISKKSFDHFFHPQQFSRWECKS